jgi:EmrB/QacA subfamily drug resistance transporter
LSEDTPSERADASGTPQATLPASAPLTEPSPRRYLVFAIVSVALFMSSVDQTIVATALGTIQHDLHARVNWSTWTITVYALGQVIAMPLAGVMSDQLGRKRVFLGAVGLFVVSSLACSLANDIYLLVALRALQALGGGAFMPSATGIVADQFGRDRDRAIGLFTSIMPMGAMVGPVLGGLFVTYWTWRGIFLVNVPVGAVLLVLAAFCIPRSHKITGRRLDLPGVALLGGGLLAIMLAISFLGGANASPADPAFIVPLLAGVLLLAGFVIHSGRATAPFVPLRLLTGKGFAIMNAINFLYGVAMLGFSALVPLYAEERYGLRPLAAGTLLTARAVGVILVGGLAALTLRRTGVRLPLIAGFLTAAAGLFLLGVHAVGLSPYAWLATAAGVAGLGMGISLPASNNAILQLAPESTAAVAGLRGMFRQAGGITRVSPVAALIARSADPALTQAHVFFAFAAILAFLPLVVFRVPEHRGQW